MNISLKCYDRWIVNESEYVRTRSPHKYSKVIFFSAVFGFAPHIGSANLTAGFQLPLSP